MNEQECLSRMVPPGKRRPNKRDMRDGVVQIMVTRACDLACHNCTQGSDLAGKPVMMSPDQFEQACISLRDHFGVVGVFGGNPALHPQFETLCDILARHIPRERRGIWCNHPRGNGKVMRRTFNPVTSNLNVHQSREAFDEFKRDWPESRPFGLDSDARHAPVFVSMKDLGVPEERRWELISGCDINQHWSALVGVFRGELRTWFCEIAGAQAMLHQHDPEYPDTGKLLWVNGVEWWRLPMTDFREQVRHHCHDCGVPLRGYGSLAQDPDGFGQYSSTHSGIYRPKKQGKRVELVTVEPQLGKQLNSTVDYMGNVRRPQEQVAKDR